MFLWIQEENPLLKRGFEQGEDAAYWMKEKAGDIATVTKWDDSLKTLDNVAASGVVKLEDTHANVNIS